MVQDGLNGVQDMCGHVFRSGTHTVCAGWANLLDGSDGHEGAEEQFWRRRRAGGIVENILEASSQSLVTGLELQKSVDSIIYFIPIHSFPQLQLTHLQTKP